MTRKKDIYQAYLLRCWRETGAAPGASSRWRFSLQEVLHERRRRGFSDLEALVSFLQAELAGAGEGAADGSRKEAL